MAMSQTILAAELEKLIPTTDVNLAIQRLTDAYGVFASDAEANLIPIEASFVDLGKTAMSGALLGLSVPGAAAAVIQAAVIAFWAAAALPLAFIAIPPATATVPPPNAGLAALNLASFPLNTIGALSLADSAAVLAANMYAQALVGGTVTFTGLPTPAPII